MRAGSPVTHLAIADMRASRNFSLPLAVLAVLWQGCHAPQQAGRPGQAAVPSEARVDFKDPVLNRRQIVLFGLIDQRAAELTVQKLLFLDGAGHDPIDLYLHTPGGELRHAMAIEQAMRLLSSPVNTYALAECNSGGALLLAAGTGRRRVFRGAVVVVHGLTSHGRPPPDFTELTQDSYAEFWRRRTRLPEAWLPLPAGVLHVLSAEQALEYGLADEVIER